ncbi:MULTISPECIES: hypothetical protein [Pseudoalteromonas]|jgi:hypothetical protein|uniref:Uncharacterized protein n=2 Tax=Pseudoalteromonas TaxID=53246 RepID=A0AAD0WBF5_9GAMM|nr:MULTISPECIES: hypothetical protein [Pseudoalteromonas]AXV63981.1 hypothetical protein D0907_01185 [Pseudoalteromonas donghaensis]EWH04287.1 hypothetical protein AT00_20895 [Pseudoalteromonas lipolytica SCSIO 04301]MBE0352353.1 hypothetical protein [Pseudoalteromonas lipolytica LMEB 39]MCC9660667.1 hypothetical protein [Pseudoalteromonas sp. MB41]QMW14714.1 hypothetical protein H3302_00925 [Pseudoalteromonas sp. MT33b]|tara:strand:+ start:1974 stop:2561 length:588 start_codon:yes stop_codon:yes gene_type:complete
MQQPNIIILGNGPVGAHIAASVNRCPRVVRFNRCADMPAHLGKRCTDLWLVGRGYQAHGLLERPLTIPLEGLSQVMITDPNPHPLLHCFFKLIHRKGKIDYANQLFKMYGLHCKCERLSAQFRQSLLAHLLTLGPVIHRPYCPSSGTLAIAFYLSQFDKIHIAGFAFRGWKRHPWHLEKRYVDGLIAANKVVLLD